MSLDIDNKVYRNMQEQVAHNASNIQKIKDFLDGLDVEDTVIVLESLSSLNSKQMKVAEQPLAFIIYDGAIYLKAKEDANYFYFERMMKMELATVITLSSAVITVTKLNGATGITVSSVNVYSKVQIDTSLGLKADISYVDTQLASGLAAKANLSGASFTGPITAPSIIEDMVGYSFIPQTKTGVTFEHIYVGAVKNGNKLTATIFGKITRTNDVSGNFCSIGAIRIPSSVADKLFPTPLGVVAGALSSKVLSCYSNTNSRVDLNSVCVKGVNLFDVSIYGLDNLVLNQEYQFRYEVTFLLSDNLAA